MECIFCKIIKKEIPGQIIYEDDYVLAFLDIAPVLPGHTIIIPKKHLENMEDLDDVILCHLIETVKKIGQAMKKSLGAKGYNIMVNNGKVAGQLIDHFHFHIIPRQDKDELKQWPQKEYTGKEAEKIKKQLSAEL